MTVVVKRGEKKEGGSELGRRESEEGENSGYKGGCSHPDEMTIPFYLFLLSLGRSETLDFYFSSSSSAAISSSPPNLPLALPPNPPVA